MLFLDNSERAQGESEGGNSFFISAMLGGTALYGVFEGLALLDTGNVIKGVAHVAAGLAAGILFESYRQQGSDTVE